MFGLVHFIYHVYYVKYYVMIITHKGFTFFAIKLIILSLQKTEKENKLVLDQIFCLSMEATFNKV